MKLTSALVGFILSSLLITSCSKEQVESDLINYYPELSLYERVGKNDPYLLEGSWRTIHIYDFDTRDYPINTGRSETITITKTHWNSGFESIPYRVEFVFDCRQWLVWIFLQRPEGEQKLIIQYTDENGYYYGAPYYMGPDSYAFASIQMFPSGSDPWRTDKVFVSNN